MTVLEEILQEVVTATQSTAAGQVFLNTPPSGYKYQGPYIVIRGVGATSDEEIRGMAVGLGQERFEFSCRARQDDTLNAADGGIIKARLMAEQIRLALQGFSGTVVQNASVASVIDGWDEDSKVHIRFLDMDTFFTEDAPLEP